MPNVVLEKILAEKKQILQESHEKQVAHVLASIPTIRGKRASYWLNFLQPPPKLTISDWADQKRVLTSEDSPESGRWITKKAEYQREPMNAIGDAMTEQVVLQWASQTGKTAGAILNCLGYYIDVDPSPILLVYPTVTMAEKVSRQRVSPMVRNCPELRAKIYRSTWRGMDRGSDSLLMKSFPGGMLIMGGAEKPASLSNFPMRVVLLDEIDRYKGDVGNEGDPIQLAITRAANFWNRKIILSSTPTIKGASRIEFAYENSSQGNWELPCPHCGLFQTLYWHQIDYTNYGGKVVAKCVGCNEGSSKVRWTAGEGRWFHKFPNHRVRGYKLNALPSPWVAWESLVDDWKLANKAKRGGNNALLKVFINTKLAETYEDYAFRVESHILYDRREYYKAEIPDGVLQLTVGIDIQDVQKRINYEVVGWGKDYECWGIEYGTILADPREKEWHSLFDDRVFNRIFRFSDGRGIRVRKGLIDANGAVGPYIYYFSKRRQPRLFSCKGSGHEQFLTTSFTGPHKHDLKYNTTWYPVNTIMGKDELFQRLLRMDSGPGFCHFPKGMNGEDARGYSNDYFEGLTSEQKHESINNDGFLIYKYKKEGASRSSGEPLDCRNYARAALELSEQTLTLLSMVNPDYVEEKIDTVSNPYFDLAAIKKEQTIQKKEKTIEKYKIDLAEAMADASEELMERGPRVPIKPPESRNPLEKTFGKFGTHVSKIDPFRDDF